MGDAGDSKSPGPCARAGSNPASGTNIINGLRGFHIRWKFLGCLDCARFSPPPPSRLFSPGSSPLKGSREVIGTGVQQSPTYTLFHYLLIGYVGPVPQVRPNFPYGRKW